MHFHQETIWMIFGPCALEHFGSPTCPGFWSALVSLLDPTVLGEDPITVPAAVRIATELQLHRAYRGALAGDRKAYIAARLYYLVHVCNHQFSIAYGVSGSAPLLAYVNTSMLLGLTLVILAASFDRRIRSSSSCR